LDYLYLEKLSLELDGELRKSRLSALFLEDRKLSLSFGKEKILNAYFGATNFLFLSSSAIATSPLSSLSFLKGSFLKRISLPYSDRVLELELVKLLSLEKVEKFYLVFELTGRNANFFVLDGERRVKFLFKPLLSSVRSFGVGDEYEPPPTFGKKEFSELKFGKVSKEGIASSLYKYALKLSPLNSKEIACIFEREGLDVERAYEEFLKRHSLSSSAFLYRDGGRPRYLTTFKYCSLEGLEYREFKGELPYSRACEEFFSEAVVQRELESLKERVLKELLSRKKALVLRLSEIEDRESLLREAESARKLGELIKANLFSLPAHPTDRLKLLDYESGRICEFEFGEALSPSEHMERLFKKAKKLRRKAELASSLREKIQEELSALELLLERVKEVKEREELLQFVRKSKEKKREQAPLRIKRYKLPSGNEILVGKSDRENELLSFQIARPWDYWFHAKDVPGSHVILRLKDRNTTPSPQELELAASAAAFFSRAASSGKVKVDFTRVKNLKKVPSSKRGFVIYRGEKTILTSTDKFKEFLEKKSPHEGAALSTEKR